jgi:hypothetical protein
MTQGRGPQGGGGVPGASLGINIETIGRLVTTALSQQIGLLAPRTPVVPVTPDEMTPISNRFGLLSAETPKTTTHGSLVDPPATKKQKVTSMEEPGELNKQKPDLDKEYRVEPVYLSGVKSELTKNVIKLGKEFKKFCQ